MVYYFNDMEGATVASSLVLYTVNLPSRHLAVIEEVKTLPEYRRQGRARRLMEQAIEKARSLGCTAVELTVREDAPTTQAFYQSLGFFDRMNRAYRLAL